MKVVQLYPKVEFVTIPRPSWWRYPYLWYRNWRVRRIMSKYTILEDIYEEWPDEYPDNSEPGD